MTNKGRHPALGALLGAAAAVGAARGVYYWLLQRPLPQTEGDLYLEGLDADVRVMRDARGVAHIVAQSRSDLFFAQGFVHAQDRLWQMEFGRRLVAGRLAEVLGTEALALDRWVRILGLGRAAAADAVAGEAESGDDLRPYVAGINAVIAGGRLPVEFTFLRYEPEPWRIADLFGWPKLMGWQLSTNWQVELARARLLDRLGPERLAELDQPYAAPVIMPPDADYAALGEVADRLAASAQAYLGGGPASGLGSNNWAVSGARTASGGALLASDMHLNLLLPSIWYENHLICADAGINVTGVSFPGMPYVVAGHNGQVAWSFTNSFVDVQDLYLEHIRRDGDEVTVEYRGAWEQAVVHRETIAVRGGERETLEIVETRHGPIINPLVQSFPAPQDALALRWTGLDRQNPFVVLRALNAAEDAVACHEALRDWVGPPQNAVYADTAGNIAYTLAGRVPVRASGDGRLPAAGWTGEHDWIGYLPYEATPHFTNPVDGLIVTANNRIVPEAYPFDLGTDFSTGDRASRIRELLGNRQDLTVADMAAMQQDQVSLTARSLRPFWAGFHVDDPALVGVVEAMAAWEGELGADSAEAVIHQVFMRRLLRAALGPLLGTDLATIAGKGPNPMLSDTTTLGSRCWSWLAGQLLEPGGLIIHDAAARDRLARQSLEETVAILAREQGESPQDWSWGQKHRLTFRHVLGSMRPLDRLFNRGPFPIGGDQTTIWATGVHYHDLATGPVIGPPNRMVIDLADLGRSISVLVPGQSGQPGSAHYDDQIQDWFEGAYHPMLHDLGSVEEAATATLNLKPAGASDAARPGTAVV